MTSLSCRALLAPYGRGRKIERLLGEKEEDRKIVRIQKAFSPIALLWTSSLRSDRGKTHSQPIEKNKFFQQVANRFSPLAHRGSGDNNKFFLFSDRSESHQPVSHDEPLHNLKCRDENPNWTFRRPFGLLSARGHLKNHLRMTESMRLGMADRQISMLSQTISFPADAARRTAPPWQGPSIIFCGSTDAFPLPSRASIE